MEMYDDDLCNVNLLQHRDEGATLVMMTVVVLEQVGQALRLRDHEQNVALPVGTHNRHAFPAQ